VRGRGFRCGFPADAGQYGVVILQGPDEPGWRLVDWREEIAGDLPATGLTDAGGR
jgi:hypothetical protein